MVGKYLSTTIGADDHHSPGLVSKINPIQTDFSCAKMRQLHKRVTVDER